MQPTRADLSRPASKIVMDLRQLRYFTVLAAHQHFGRAAAVLHIAQPALSRQVQLLEAELGVKLVERHSRGASLTREGELLLDRATFLLRYADQIRVDIMDLQGTPRGTVALGLPPAFAGFFVLPLTRALRDQYPEVRLRVNESSRHRCPMHSNAARWMSRCSPVRSPRLRRSMRNSCSLKGCAQSVPRATRGLRCRRCRFRRSARCR